VSHTKRRGGGIERDEGRRAEGGVGGDARAWENGGHGQVACHSPRCVDAGGTRGVSAFEIRGSRGPGTGRLLSPQTHRCEVIS
jgi:hypothetical protein